VSYSRDEKSKTYIVWHSKRHPVTRKVISLRRTGITSERIARKVEDEIKLKIEEKIRAKIIPTWESAVERYVKNLSERGLTGKTIESYATCLRAHTYGDWKNRLVDTITSNEIRELIGQKLSKRSASHQKNMLKYIRGVFNFLADSGDLNRNPSPTMKFRIGDKLKTVLTAPQVRLLLNRAREMESEWYYHWCLATYLGMRNGELYSLTWDKVDFEKRQILVNCSWTKKDGLKDTKSGDDRIAEIAPQLALILKELKLKYLDTVFVLPRIDKWDKGEQARELRMFLEGVGLPRIRFHDLRATWATIMLSKGIVPIMVMKMGGWKDLKTMQKYIRKAGIDISGMTNELSLHDASSAPADILEFGV
jgi:integrase